MLRELELLPAWKLRVPVEAALTQKVQVEKIEVADVATTDPSKPVKAHATQYEITMSQDQHWAFVCELDLPEGRVDNDLQSTLFNNILHALSIENPSKIQAESIVELQAKMIVAMGEGVAQVLLNTQDALENLCGKLHAAGTAYIIATYDLTHLLNYPLDKAKVWQDLCLARSYLQGLQVQD